VVLPDKPLELELRLRNNELKSRRLQLGLSTTELAKKAGMQYGDYIRLENLKVTPYREDGSPRKGAALLCKFYRVLPEDLFPPDVRAVSNPVQFVPVGVDDMARLLGTAPDPETLALEEERRKGLPAALSELSKREAEVVRRRFGLDGEEPQLRSMIGAYFDVSPERIRQVEVRALRKLRGALSGRATEFASHRIVTAAGKRHR
jgi:transcriptional regulator with XRE-family HTH domain